MENAARASRRLRGETMWVQEPCRLWKPRKVSSVASLATWIRSSSWLMLLLSQPNQAEPVSRREISKQMDGLVSQSAADGEQIVANPFLGLQPAGGTIVSPAR